MNVQDIVGVGKTIEGIETLTRECRSLLNEFLSPVAKETGALAGDCVRLVRLTTVATVLRKAKARLCEGRHQQIPGPLKTIFPLLESCSLEEDSEMIDRWAN